MATGAAPALEARKAEESAIDQTSDAKPLTLMDRIIRKLNRIFEYNEALGVTRH